MPSNVVAEELCGWDDVVSIFGTIRSSVVSSSESCVSRGWLEMRRQLLLGGNRECSENKARNTVFGEIQVDKQRMPKGCVKVERKNRSCHGPGKVRRVVTAREKVTVA